MLKIYKNIIVVFYMPFSEENGKGTAGKFEDLWNLPHCLGTIDGNHIANECPPNIGSKYLNYQQFYSVVLFSVVDANYKFLHQYRII